ncbi:LacI family DNA-binding transcriptional regulator [Nesterenkonia sp. PF2B19]|uniref:LacI family DNA-binding transcriptional regulator n=1 Tax=Nesterenkonia sp. PF2B19 TaxID=1881858 RepID=UPI003FA5DD2D
MASSSRRPSGRAPSMIDVARAAGVSHQTVSRVLNTPDASARTPDVGSSRRCAAWGIGATARHGP